MSRRVIFVPDDHWTDPPPKENNVTKQPAHPDAYNGRKAEALYSVVALMEASLDGDEAKKTAIAAPFRQDAKPLISGLMTLCVTLLEQYEDPRQMLAYLRQGVMHAEAGEIL